MKKLFVTLAMVLMTSYASAAMFCPFQVTCSSSDPKSCQIGDNEWVVDIQDTKVVTPNVIYKFTMADYNKDYGNTGSCFLSNDIQSAPIVLKSVFSTSKPLDDMGWQWLNLAHTWAQCHESNPFKCAFLPDLK